MIGAQVKVLRVVKRSDLLGAPLRAYFNRLLIAAHSYAIQPGHVPIDEGYLRRSLAIGGGTSRVDESSPPLWAVLGTDKDYGGYLNNSDRFHYRDGPSAGEPTLGWLSNTLDNIGGEIQGAHRQLAADMQSAWSGS